MPSCSIFTGVVSMVKAVIVEVSFRFDSMARNEVHVGEIGLDAGVCVSIDMKGLLRG